MVGDNNEELKQILSAQRKMLFDEKCLFGSSSTITLSPRQMVFVGNKKHNVPQHSYRLAQSDILNISPSVTRHRKYQHTDFQMNTNPCPKSLTVA